jgi:flagellar basal-body rod modification protein FlgD
MSVINNDADIYSALGLAREAEDTKASRTLAMEDFLELMVTELTHQDPFKPMENSEMATQISQFATVSGIDELNNSFTDLSGSMLSDQALQAANLVGHDVLAPIGTGYLSSGGSVDGVVGLYSSAENVSVRITNSEGVQVRELTLGTQDKGEVAFSWDGIMEDGSYAPPGQYQITAQATQDGEPIVPYTLIKAKVNSVSLGGPGQEMALNLEGLGPISFNDVAEIH